MQIILGAIIAYLVLATLGVAYLKFSKRQFNMRTIHIFTMIGIICGSTVGQIYTMSIGDIAISDLGLNLETIGLVFVCIISAVGASLYTLKWKVL